MKKVIAFDGDDTLWHHENIFYHTKEKFKQVMMNYGDTEGARRAVAAAQINNLPLYGYGVKGFALSMIEEAIRWTDGKITGEDIQKLIEFGKDMLRSPVMLCDGALETVETLHKSGKYQLMIITKGDLFDQETKIKHSGLSEYFDFVEVVSEKSEETYANIIQKHNINIQEFLMVGNSVKSDVLPVLSIGGDAVQIPYFTTWGHEQVSDEKIKEDFSVFQNIKEVLHYIK